MPCDLSNQQLDYMESILNEIIQPQLKARIADFLWTYSSPYNTPRRLDQKIVVSKIE